MQGGLATSAKRVVGFRCGYGRICTFKHLGLGLWSLEAVHKNAIGFNGANVTLQTLRSWRSLKVFVDDQAESIHAVDCCVDDRALICQERYRITVAAHAQGMQLRIGNQVEARATAVGTQVRALGKNDATPKAATAAATREHVAARNDRSASRQIRCCRTSRRTIINGNSA